MKKKDGGSATPHSDCLGRRVEASGEERRSGVKPARTDVPDGLPEAPPPGGGPGGYVCFVCMGCSHKERNAAEAYNVVKRRIKPDDSSKAPALV